MPPARRKSGVRVCPVAGSWLGSGFVRIRWCRLKPKHPAARMLGFSLCCRVWGIRCWRKLVFTPPSLRCYVLGIAVGHAVLVFAAGVVAACALPVQRHRWFDR